jgi:hypothetical protein
MSELLAEFDFQSIGIIGLCLALGFFIVWTYLSARSDDRKSSHRSSSSQENKDTT